MNDSQKIGAFIGILIVALTVAISFAIAVHRARAEERWNIVFPDGTTVVGTKLSLGSTYSNWIGTNGEEVRTRALVTATKIDRVEP